MTTLEFEPLIPIALWAGLAAGAVLLLALYGRNAARRMKRARWLMVVALMTAAVAMPLLILLNPLWMERIPPPEGKPVLSILIDNSASMATPDGAKGRTRYEVAVEIVTTLAQQLRDRYEIHLSTFAASVTSANVTELSSQTPSGAYTDIAGALHASLETDRVQGQAIVLVSDGIHNAGSQAQVLDAARLANALSAPIYTQVVGGATAVRDLAIEVRSPQELAFVGQRVPVRVIVQPRGLTGGKAEISLWDGDKRLETRAVTIASEDQAEVEFHVQQDHSGVYRYEIRAEPMPHEVTVANNQCMYLLRVVDEPIRVLVLEGNPYWDTKFLMRHAGDRSGDRVDQRRAAERKPVPSSAPWPAAQIGSEAQPALSPDAARDVGASPENAVANQADVPAGAESPSLPGSRREAWKVLADGSMVLGNVGSLDGYQIVVLGRDADVFLTDAAIGQLRRWLSRGGGSLICFRGAPAAQINERLRQILPVRWTAAASRGFICS